MEHILAIDAGSTGIRAVLVDGAGAVRGLAYRELAVQCPEPGLVEADPTVILDSALAVSGECLASAKLRPADLAAVGIVNQRATTVVWEAASLRPVHPAILWQDTRTAERVAELLARGAFVSSMASLTKAEWILDRVAPERRAGLRFGTIDSWLVAGLTAGAAHVTDSSNASCTGMYDPFGDCWDPRLLEMVAIPAEMMPGIRPSSGVVAMTSREVFGAEVPIAGIAGDQQAAMVAELGFAKGATKITIGTSAMVDVHVGAAPVLSVRGAFPLVLWRIGEDLAWCLEGSVVTAGASVQWLRDGLGIVGSLEESSTLAASVADSGGVWALPALQGTGTPHMQAKARARIGGMSRSTSRAHVVRAVLEGVAFRIREAVETLAQDGGISLPDRLRVDGGAAANDFLLQQLADATGLAVERPECIQASAVGGAYLAGLGVGIWKGWDELGHHWRSGGLFEPSLDAEAREDRFRRWQKLTAPSRAELED